MLGKVVKQERSSFTNLRQFLSALRKNNLVTDVYAQVDSKLEIAEIHRRVVAASGPALLFHNVKGSSFPVLTNMFGTEERVNIAFRNRPHELVANAVRLATRDFPPSLKTLWEHRNTFKPLLKLGAKNSRRSPLIENSLSPIDLNTLPLLQSWPEDGGHFITLPLVYTESPSGGAPNLGMYRIQRFDSRTCGLHWQIAKGGGHHFFTLKRL